MDSPRTKVSSARDTSSQQALAAAATQSARSSVIESLKGCTLAGLRIPKEELRKKITIPEYLRLAMKETIVAKDVNAPAAKILFDAAHAAGAELVHPPEGPLVVFINSRSGGRHGPELKARLQILMGEEQVSALLH